MSVTIYRSFVGSSRRHSGARPEFTPSLTVGAGIQTSYDHSQPTGGTSADTFALNHMRLYFSGDITKNISAMFNTEYNSAPTRSGSGRRWRIPFLAEVQHLVWTFLPPSDRANLYGPFYPTMVLVYTDGIQDGYTFVSQGRDNGAMYWGDFKAGTVKIKASVGAFDGSSAMETTSDLCGPRSAGLLGSRKWLLPKRNLLRRQKPAGPRRGFPSAGWENRLDG